MMIQEIEAFFADNEVPVGTMLNKGTKVIEPDKFLEVNIMTIKEWQNDLNKCPSY
ncbi:DUF6965 family protein [Olivibacter sitiensis]|uniref:DUF6965 family protein n=1 Tax=Olivibacter sitiensis TaxID=376470 RepID=UPI0012FCAA61|nr:hypothetical protein [Olivibacter sitiensis]